MSRIFMSHSHVDARQALALKKWLVEQDPALANEIFLDIDPDTGLRAGDRWKVGLQRASTRCEAVICVLSKSWSASHECLAEYRLAEYLNKQVLCARLGPSKGDNLSSEWQHCDLFGNGHKTAIDIGDGRPVRLATKGLQQLGDAVRGAGIGARSFAWPPPGQPERPPYRGWEPFEPQDAAVFFGRDTALVRAVDELRGARGSGVVTLFMVLGPSGTGKSSFLRAGILPRLVREDRRFITFDVVRPGLRPITGDDGLAVSITNARRRFGLAQPLLGEISAACAQDPAAVQRLLSEVQRAAADRLPDEGDVEPPAPPTLVVPLDQAEELLAADAGTEAAQFFSLLASLAQADLGLVVVATIRTDRYDAMQSHPAVADLTTHVFDDLKPMPPTQFKEVITGPAERATSAGHRLSLEPQLVDRLMADAAEGGDALPLMSLTLAELHRGYGAGGVLTLDQYHAMGGIDRVVQNAIDSVLDSDSSKRTEQLEVLRDAFIPWLATINPGNGQPMRRIAKWKDLPEGSRPLIDALVDKRLMVKDLRDGDVVVEVALESLLRQWEDLAGWLRQRRDDLLDADELQRTATAWTERGRDAAWLPTGTRLIDAEKLLVTPGFAERLAGVAPFLAAARDQENARLRIEEQHRAAELVAAQEKQATAEAHGRTLRKRSLITTAIAVVAVLVAVAAGVGFVLASKAQTAAQLRFREATSVKLVADADATSRTEVVPALHKVLAANAIAPTPAARSALYRNVIANKQTTRIIAGHDDLVLGVAFSPDGSRLASASFDRTVRLWDPTTGTQLGEPLTGHTDRVNGVAFSPDGTRLATASEDDTARLWDPTTGKQLGEPLTGHTAAVRSVAFSPDGTRIATASEDDTVRLWDPTTGIQLGAPFTGHAGGVAAVAYSADGTRLATAGGDGTIRLWNAATGKPMGHPLTGHEGTVWAVAFNRDGTRLASAGADETVRLWNPATGKQLGEPLAGHTDTVLGVAFSPDGNTLASASEDQTVRLWNAATGAPVGAPLTGHPDSVVGVAFSPDGTRLATAGADSTIRLWNPAASAQFGPFTGHTDAVLGIASSPDGTRLATASTDATVRLWDAATGVAIGEPLTGHTGTVWAVAFSPDGARLASASFDGTARLWDAATGRQLGEPLTGHTGAVTDVAFSRDGTRLATAGADRTVRLWDATTGVAIGEPLTGHTAEVNRIAFSPDGRQLASTSTDATIRRWDAATGEPIGEPLTGHTDEVYGLAFSPDGAQLATAGADRTIRLWDATTGVAIGEPLTGHTDEVYGVAFSPDGTTLATTSQDKTVRLWNPIAGAQLAVLTGHEESVWDIAFTPDGRRVETASADRTVRFWPATASAEDLCAKLTFNMSERQWDDWVSPDIDYLKVCPDLPIAPDA